MSKYNLVSRWVSDPLAANWLSSSKSPVSSPMKSTSTVASSRCKPIESQQRRRQGTVPRFALVSNAGRVFSGRRASLGEGWLVCRPLRSTSHENGLCALGKFLERGVASDFPTPCKRRATLPNTIAKRLPHQWTDIVGLRGRVCFPCRSA